MFRISLKRSNGPRLLGTSEVRDSLGQCPSHPAGSPILSLIYIYNPFNHTYIRRYINTHTHIYTFYVRKVSLEQDPFFRPFVYSLRHSRFIILRSGSRLRFILISHKVQCSATRRTLRHK